MDAKTRSIIIGALSLLIVAAVIGVIFYISKATKGRINSAQGQITNILPELPTTPAVTPITRGTTPQPTPTVKLYAGQGFSLDYPTNWGLLTCNNSKNIEFDPYSSSDLKGVACVDAIKPVTVLVVNKLNCPGTLMKLGSWNVAKSKTVAANGDINYRWCMNSGPIKLDITQRVSQTGSRATSKDDFSAAVEQIISTFKLTPQGS